MQAFPSAFRQAIAAIAACILLSHPPAHGAEASGKPAAPADRGPRGFRAFQPKPGERADEPAAQLVQILLDRQDKGDFDSYMVQVLFRGKPAGRKVRVREDRVELEFLDTGKPAMRLARIRGGAVEASSIEEFFYRVPGTPGKDGPGSPRTKRLVRLTLFMKAKPELHFRDTLDRTLVHFRLEKPRPGK
jgi:hypothetical protein